MPVGRLSKCKIQTPGDECIALYVRSAAQYQIDGVQYEIGGAQYEIGGAQNEIDGAQYKIVGCRAVWFLKYFFCSQGPVHRSWDLYFIFNIWQDARIRTGVAATAARCATNIATHIPEQFGVVVALYKISVAQYSI